MKETVDDRLPLVQCLEFYQCLGAARAIEATMEVVTCSRNSAAFSMRGHVPAEVEIRDQQLSEMPTFEVVLDEASLGERKPLTCEVQHDVKSANDAAVQESPPSVLHRVASCACDVSSWNLTLDDDSDILDERETTETPRAHLQSAAETSIPSTATAVLSDTISKPEAVEMTLADALKIRGRRHWFPRSHSERDLVKTEKNATGDNCHIKTNERRLPLMMRLRGRAHVQRTEANE
jgi:hypothetical protein